MRIFELIKYIVTQNTTFQFIFILLIFSREFRLWKQKHSRKVTQRRSLEKQETPSLKNKNFVTRYKDTVIVLPWKKIEGGIIFLFTFKVSRYFYDLNGGVIWYYLSHVSIMKIVLSSIRSFLYRIVLKKCCMDQFHYVKVLPFLSTLRKKQRK